MLDGATAQDFKKNANSSLTRSAQRYSCLISLAFSLKTESLLKKNLKKLEWWHNNDGIDDEAESKKKYSNALKKRILNMPCLLASNRFMRHKIKTLRVLGKCREDTINPSVRNEKLAQHKKEGNKNS